jgi:MoaA/NifB/PqqE/SkfB family radical SAM enzyme/tetratricopeptide (TPR) repeat protein
MLRDEHYRARDGHDSPAGQGVPMPRGLSGDGATQEKKNIVILGSGRSGTSLAAGLFARAGYFMGDALYEPRDANPKGFFEDAEVNSINEELIAALPAEARHGEALEHGQRWLARVRVGTTWASTPAIERRIAALTERTPFCFKDPRLSYTLPAWRPCLRDTLHVCVFRDPATLVQSILRECRSMPYLQDLAMSRERALAIWGLMYRHILEHHCREGEWLFLHYDQCFDRAVLDRLETLSGARLDRTFPDRALTRSHPDFLVPQEAEDLYRRLCGLAQFPYDPVATLRSVIDGQERTIERLQLDIDRFEADSAYRGLEPLIVGERYGEAVEFLTEFLRRYPSFACAHNDLAVLLYRDGRKDEALQHYEHALALAAENVNYLKNLADFHLVERGCHEEARLLYEKVIALTPDDAEAWAALGHVAIAEGRCEDALGFLRQAVAIDPRNAVAIEGLRVLATINPELGIPAPRVEPVSLPETPAPATLVLPAGQTEHPVAAACADPSPALIPKCTAEERFPKLNTLLEGIAASLPDAPHEALATLAEKTARITVRLQEALRQAEAGRQPIIPGVVSFDGQPLTKHVVDPSAPWRQIAIPPYVIPGMISDEEKQYYLHISRYYSGAGAAVELGPWLGCSTAYILHGLLANPLFAGRRLYVFDDFVWRSSWMDGYYQEADRPRNHQSFRHIFERFVEPFQARMVVRRRRISLYDGNEEVEPFCWTDGPIEMAFIDCGRSFAANEAWYEVMKHSFLPGRTLIILQDWQTHKEIPVKWYNQMKEFTDSHAGDIELVHELAQGGVATFLYRGSDGGIRRHGPPGSGPPVQPGKARNVKDRPQEACRTRFQASPAAEGTARLRQRNPGVVCYFPFTTLDFSSEGTVIFCCGFWTKHKLGSMKNQTIGEIWNGDKAQYVRECMYNGRWGDVCNDSCSIIASYKRKGLMSFDELIARGFPKGLIEEMKQGKTSLGSPPVDFQLANSPICNLSCIMCNVHEVKNDPVLVKKVEDDLYTYLPTARYVRMCGFGDPLARPDTRRLLMEYQGPKGGVQFGLLTNGLLLKKYWEDIKHQDFSDISISIDAATPETYEKIRRRGKWQTLVENLELVRDNRDRFRNNIAINMTVMRSNFREIPAFIHLGSHYGFSVDFQRIYGTYGDENIFDPGDGETLEELRSTISQVTASPHGLKGVRWNNIVEFTDGIGSAVTRKPSARSSR